MKCVLCKERPGRRQCPAVNGYICPLCCGREREVSLECPFECSYLQQGHRNEIERLERPAEPAHASHDVSREFVEENQRLVAGLAVTLLQAAVAASPAGHPPGLAAPGVIDADLNATLDSLIRTYETLSTGLVYESLPEGPTRAHLFRELQSFVEQWRREETERTGMSRLRDGDVLRALVFLRRLGQTHDNKRPRGKLFYGYLLRMFPQQPARQAPSVIVP